MRYNKFWFLIKIEKMFFTCASFKNKRNYQVLSFSIHAIRNKEKIESSNFRAEIKLLSINISRFMWYLQESTAVKIVFYTFNSLKNLKCKVCRVNLLRASKNLSCQNSFLSRNTKYNNYAETAYTNYLK